MRTFILTVAMAGLGCLLGCGEYAADDGELASAPPPAPRVNLFPLTSPPPGAVQPLRGYAPTRLPAMAEPQYGPEVYRDEFGNVELAARNTGALYDAAYSTGAAAQQPAPDGLAPAYTDPYADSSAGQGIFAAAPAAVAVSPETAEYPVTYPEGFVTQPAVYAAGAPAAAPTTVYMTAEAAAAASVAAGFDPADPASPYYCPPGAAYCPVPGSALPGAVVAATPANTFGLESPAAAVTYPALQAAPAPVAAAPAYQVATYAAPTAPAYQTAAYTATTSYTTTPASATLPAAATTYAVAPASYAPPAAQPAPLPPAPAPAAQYTPPLRLSAAARMPAVPSTSQYERNAPRGLHFGEAEGTADIIGPVPSLDPIVRPAYSPAYPPAPAYGAPYSRPISMNVETAPETAAAPQTAAAPARRPAIGGQQSSVAGISAVSSASAARGEYRLVPATDIPPGNHPGDFGPSQWFEVVRPGNGPVRIGRLSATCACVGARIPKRHYAEGERILVEARMLSKPARNNLTYGLYVNILEPVETVVDADVTLSY